jgi:unsaturated chondroitin disaccharide hydrolase
LGRLEGTGEQVNELRQTGWEIIESILDSYLVTEGGRRRGMILHGCYEKPSNYAIDNELIWTNYYVAYLLHDLIQGN